MKYATPREASQILQVSERTLRNWDRDGKIRIIRTPAASRRYDIVPIVNPEGDTRIRILYARVSSYKQKSDLERQADYLQSLFTDGLIIKDIGSGLNYKRKRLLSLLGQVLSGNVREVVVCHKDRLVRFGFDLIEWFCQQQNCQLVVLNRSDLSPEREMVEDILAIVHVYREAEASYSCRLYGLRKYKSVIKEDSDLPRDSLG
jgi:predicted site-specific integrase-resolvase